MLGRLSGRVRVLTGLDVKLSVFFLRAPTRCTTFRLMVALDMRGRDHLLIAKYWSVVTTHAAVAESIRVYRCSGKHEHSKDFDLKATQHYPVALVRSFFEALRS